MLPIKFNRKERFFLISLYKKKKKKSDKNTEWLDFSMI